MTADMPLNARSQQAMAVTKAVCPHQLAWLRRPELDRENGGLEVWEKPDGDLYRHDPAHGTLVLLLLGYD